MVWCQLWYGSPHFSVERLRCRLKRSLSGTVSDHFYVITSKPQEPREELCSKRHRSIAGLSVILRFPHTDTHLPSHQELSTNDSHNHSIYRQWPLQVQRLEPLGSECNIGAINSVVPVKNALPFLLQGPTGGEEKEGKSTKGGEMMRWWRDQMGGNGEGRKGKPLEYYLSYTTPWSMLREAERGRKREDTRELGRVEIKEHYTYFFPVETQRRGARGFSMSHWKKGRICSSIHPSIHPSIQTLKLRCFSSCEATGRKSDRNTEIQTNPRKKWQEEAAEVWRRVQLLKRVKKKKKRGCRLSGVRNEGKHCAM